MGGRSHESIDMASYSSTEVKGALSTQVRIQGLGNHRVVGPRGRHFAEGVGLEFEGGRQPDLAAPPPLHYMCFGYHATYIPLGASKTVT